MVINPGRQLGSFATHVRINGKYLHLAAWLEHAHAVEEHASPLVVFKNGGYRARDDGVKVIVGKGGLR